MAIWWVMLVNEQTWHSEKEIGSYRQKDWDVMHECVSRGFESRGF
jgi:L-serine deaminase